MSQNVDWHLFGLKMIAKNEGMVLLKLDVDYIQKYTYFNLSSSHNSKLTLKEIPWRNVFLHKNISTKKQVHSR